MKRILFTLTITLTLCLSAFAQSDKNKKLGKWMDDMRQIKMEFVVKELNLTTQQKEKFAPMYDAMCRETGKLARETRALEKSICQKGDAATDLEYEKAAEAMLEFKGKEYEIEKKYHAQFKTVLSKKQLFKLQRAERKFGRELMKQHREGKHNKHKKR